ncbi:MAG: response regulator transcription factor [Cyclobacteriaceae bacterium]
MKSIKVYIADDHPIVRQGMVRLLSTFKRVCDAKEAANGKELIDLLAAEPADAVIMDVEMPVMGGIEAARIISQRYPSVKILILTLHTEEVFVNRLLDMGVNGFLTKSTEPEELEKALYAIVDNDFYKNSIVENSLKKNHKETSNEHHTKLSTREVEILILICQDLTPGDISQRLQISEKTFFNHRANILEKTGARSNVGLVRFAIQRGYIKGEYHNH